MGRDREASRPVTIERAWIQNARGEFVNRNGFTAWQGFEEKRYETRFFEWPELKSGKVPIGPYDMLVGGVETVRRAWAILGVRPPDPLDLPECLTGYIGRPVWTSTLGEIRRCDRAEPPVFVKPLR